MRTPMNDFDCHITRSLRVRRGDARTLYREAS
jgi:hypothetical protein